MRWISVRNWRKFQHYDPEKRQPPWIKNYTELLHSNEYLRLPPGTRSLLHGLWLEYASSRCQLPLDTRSLSRRLNLRVTMQQLKSLSRAGFIDIVASDALAEGYQAASAVQASRAPAHSLEVEVEKDSRAVPVSSEPAPAPEDNGKALVNDQNEQGSVFVPPTLKAIP
jgi:hypothetical protein